MQIDVLSMEGKAVGQIDLADGVFAAPVKDYLLWELVKAQRAARRAGTHDTRTRAEVRGGGRKPYKQKGTGNARQGSLRAPNFAGGGKVFGPHPRRYSYSVPKKVKRAALASALSLRAREKKLLVVDKLVFDAPKTKRLAGVLSALGLEGALIVDARENGNLAKSVRNVPTSKWIAPEGLNVYDILDHPALIIAADVVRKVEARVISPPGQDQPPPNPAAAKGRGRP